MINNNELKIMFLVVIQKICYKLISQAINRIVN